jgi:hypothetical protein
MPATDHHRDVRDAVKDALAAALADDGAAGVAVYAQDVPDLNAVDLPAVIVFLGGSEGFVGGTNARDDLLYPVAVGLFTVSPDDPAGDPPGVHPTRLRNVARRAFHHRRSVSVDGNVDVYLVQYEPQPPVVDEGLPAFGQLRTSFGISVIARVARGS